MLAFDIHVDAHGIKVLGQSASRLEYQVDAKESSKCCELNGAYLYILQPFMPGIPSKLVLDQVVQDSGTLVIGQLGKY